MASSSASSNHHDIDESLYSRQLYVMGHEAQRRMAKSNVLIAGLNGLGVEVAKNVILAGVRSVTLYDNKNTTTDDLAAQFYLSEADIGCNRGVVSTPKLAELNPYVQVHNVPTPASVSTSEAAAILAVINGGTPATHEPFHVVVLIDQTFATHLEVAEFCHQKHIAILIGDVRGVFGQIFCDFGKNFVVHDKDGEPVASSMIASITRDTKGLITVLEDGRHNLNTGDIVTLTDVVGMDELNGRQFEIDVKDPFSFEIHCDTSNYKPYERSGYINQVKQSVTLHFESFADSLLSPGEIICDSVKSWRIGILHFAFRALHRFVEHHGSLPQPGNVDHAQELVKLVAVINSEVPGDKFRFSDGELQDHEEFIKRFSLCARGVISPMCALIGGVLGQEVLKACSGKFMPIKQWFYYDGLTALPSEPLSIEEVSPLGSRYDGQIMVFGKEMQHKLSKLNMFLVGAGAIGCEMLKNWSMMGIASHFGGDSTGKVHVTDMDQIEKSNLSRQFLFRNTDINCPKSTTAIRAVRGMNSTFQAIAYEQKVSNETEAIFNDDFYDSMDMICTALDNVEARLYLDQKCLFYQKPMLESGTLGAKGHTQIVAPGKTENYGASRDPPEKSIPICTLKHFPNQIEHTLPWAREWFEEIFKQAADDVNQYLTNPDYYQQLSSNNQQNMKFDTVKRLKESLVTQRPSTINDCVTWARHWFEDLFSNRIKQLLHNFPLDRMTSNGTPFWSGAKKPPTPVEFNPTDPLHSEFIVAVANMRALVYQISPCEDKAYMLAVASAVKIEPFQPAEGIKIAATEEELKAEKENNQRVAAASTSADIDAVCNSIIQSIPPRESFGSFLVRPVDFDKDIDSHMRVVAAASNLRARNYRIPEADMHTSRGIAGKITPAIATTTALVTGGICLEIFKLLLNKPVEELANTFSNLAIPIFTSMEPEPPKYVKSIVKGREWKWSPWDRIDINKPDMTVTDLIAHLDENYGVELSMLSSGVTILFSDFMDRKKKMVSF